MIIMPVNEESLIVKFENEISLDIHLKIKYYCNLIESKMEIVDILSGYNSILISYDYMNYDFSDFKECIESVDYSKTSINDTKKIIHIPVCYDEKFAPDIIRVAEHSNLSIEEVIKKHIEPEYLVHMIGFTPGFPYLGGMDQEIATPRLESPRIRIEAGSVGIGDKQTGIYPASTPGGWNIIGKTPVKLFDIKSENASLLEMGNYIKFVEISLEEFEKISDLIKNNNYLLKVEVIS